MQLVCQRRLSSWVVAGRRFEMTKAVDNHMPNLESGSSARANMAPAAMAQETVYILQAYVAGRGKGLKAEPQVGCKTAEEARRKAERLAPLRVGVVAFAATADVEMGDYDDNPTILFKAGRLPPPWDEG